MYIVFLCLLGAAMAQLGNDIFLKYFKIRSNPVTVGMMAMGKLVERLEAEFHTYSKDHQDRVIEKMDDLRAELFAQLKESPDTSDRELDRVNRLYKRVDAVFERRKCP